MITKEKKSKELVAIGAAAKSVTSEAFRIRKLCDLASTRKGSVHKWLFSGLMIKMIA